jgi:hypothetical protein
MVTLMIGTLHGYTVSFVFMGLEVAPLGRPIS